jgi:thiol-disulfide isomerase/thioredoxin
MDRVARLAVSALLLVCIGSGVSEAESRTAPAFDLELVQGDGSGVLADYAGRVVIIEFWATYCGWCKSTHPKLAALQKTEGDDGIAVIGISAQGKRRLTRYLRNKTVGFTVVWDKRGRVSRKYRARAVPTLVVVDQNGTIRYQGTGVRAAKRAIAIAKRLSQ